MADERPAVTPDPAGQALQRAEQAGIRFAMYGRNLALFPFAVFVGVGGLPPASYIGAGIISIFILLGFMYARLVGGEHDRSVYKYLFFTMDTAAIAWVFAVMPLTLGGEVAPIFIFRVYSPDLYYIVMAASTLTLSPKLVLWTGLSGAVSWLTLFFWSVEQMPRTVSWADLPPAAPPDIYLSIFLDPDFIGSSSRYLEAITLIVVASILAWAVHRARQVVLARAQAETERRNIRAAFGQYVPDQVVAALIHDPESLRPSRRYATVLFMDVEGFTTLSERREPEEVIAILNDLFDAVTQVLADHGGVVTNLQGDAVLAAFNAPLDRPDHALSAVRAGRAILEMSENRTFLGETIRVRIGINTGELAAGSVGGSRRQTYTVHGDAVNVAARLEAMNKQTKTRLLISEQTLVEAGLSDEFEPKGELPVRGRVSSVQVFSPRTTDM